MIFKFKEFLSKEKKSYTWKEKYSKYEESITQYFENRHRAIV